LRHRPAEWRNRHDDADAVAFAVLLQPVGIEYPAIGIDIGEIGLIAA